jgi:para-nitrobenzyl esterase
VTSVEFEQQMRALYGEHASRIIDVNPHATDAEALQAARNVFRDSGFGWPTWTWARLQSRKGRGAVYVYYFDHRTSRSPNGAWHTDEIEYVFRNLGARGFRNSGEPGRPAPRPEDTAISELVSNYWVNFARSGDPNGPGLPIWPKFTEQNQQVMFLDPAPSARPVPNLPQLEALDAYYTARRALSSSR